MPSTFMKALSISPESSDSEGPKTPEGAHTPGHLVKSVLVHPDFVEPILIAMDDDAKYKPLYDEYTRTGKVHPLADENELFSMMRYRIRTGGPGGPAKEADYNDKHVYLCSTSRTLTIKHWIVAHPTLVIDLDKVLYIRPARDVVANAGVEAWGVGQGGIGWARDLDRLPPTGRAYRHSYVCEFTKWGDEFCAGFTVEDPARFVRELDQLAPGITSGLLDEEVGEVGLGGAPGS